MSFERLVRYENEGQAFYGELVGNAQDGFYKVRQLRGDIFTGLEHTGITVTVERLLCPLESTPIIQCVGLNYKKHAEETKLPVPEYPVIFTKPADALAGPFDDIPIHKDTREKLDWEGELCVIMGKDAKNISEAEALDYVLGYTIGNDVSARHFQLPGASGGQFCYGKSFDKFAPIGPIIASKTLIPDPHKLELRTLVNGEKMQETETGDMIWSIPQIIAHLARGTTLRKGTVIMTGTPSGVGLFQNRFLKNGDLVVVEIDGIGAISNKMVYED
ncbi:fumarylacetoacetate hydrolase [Penicillium herquei]|nr:fumarylacetoacetate hydrolase [Penicillium herquei]